MTAIARTFQSAGEVETSKQFEALKKIALFCGAGLLVTLVCLTCGLDLGPGLL